MPDYKYQGTSRSGSSVSGVMTASNKTELASLLKRQQITATKMTEKGKEFSVPTFGGGVKAKELAIFTRQFSAQSGRRRRDPLGGNAQLAKGLRCPVRQHG